jgi:hypothetical protein
MSFDGIASYPANGQIYTLSPINGSSLSAIEKTYFFSAQQKGFTIRSNDAMTIDLMDASGKKVQSYQYTQTQSLQTIEPNLGAGVYFLNITIGNQNFIEKILLY